MTYRVVQWATGNVGRHSIAGIDAHPELELVGLWVSSPAKVGKDAGELAGLGRDARRRGDERRRRAARAEAGLHRAHRDGRPPARRGDRGSRAVPEGRASTSSPSGPVFLQFPYGVMPDGMIDPIVDAATSGGASLFVNGIDPRLRERLAAARDDVDLASASNEVRCMEILNYATYNQPMVIFDIMGFGRFAGRDAVHPHSRRADDRVGERRPPDRCRPRHRAGRGRRAPRARRRPGGHSRSPPGRSTPGRRPACASRSAA